MISEVLQVVQVLDHLGVRQREERNLCPIFLHRTADESMPFFKAGKFS